MRRNGWKPSSLAGTCCAALTRAVFWKTGKLWRVVRVSRTRGLMATATRHSTWFGKYWSTNDCQDCFGVERRAVTAEATGIIQYQQLRLDPRGNPWKRLSNRKKPTTRYSREEVSKELTSWRIGT